MLEKYDKRVFGRVFSYLENHKVSFVIGVLITVLLGLIYPTFSYFLGEIINALLNIAKTDPASRQKGRNDANTASLIFLLLGIGIIVLTLIRDSLTHFVGSEITYNIRS